MTETYFFIIWFIYSIVTKKYEEKKRKLINYIVLSTCELLDEKKPFDLKQIHIKKAGIRVKRIFFDTTENEGWSHQKSSTILIYFE